MRIGEDLRNFIQTIFNIKSTLFWLHQKRENRRFKNFFDTVDRVRPSSFALELLNGEYDVQHVGRSTDAENVCPECLSGLIEEKRPGFAACSNFPYCEFVAPECSDCGTGFLLLLNEGSRTIYRCTDDECDGSAAICPKCRVGAVIRKKGKYGDMLACHIWPRCDYIEKRPTKLLPQHGRFRHIINAG
jgi:ssDNA-binding Zn-finger/Zn-ribbon topoisomerase 1